MTDVSNKETAPIHTFKDAASLYAPLPTSMTGKVGIESERHLFRRADKGPEMIEPAEMMEIQQELKQQGLNAQLEAASVLEYASPAYDIKDANKLFEEAALAYFHINQTLNKAGIEEASFAVMPTVTLQDAQSKMIERERLRVGIKSLVEVSPHGAAAVALLTAGVQVSFSPEDKDQLFRMAYRSYALTPLLLASMDSNSGYVEGDKRRKTHHIRGEYYLAYGAAGGIAESFLKATDGESYINNHIRQVFKTPMYFAYGKDALIPSTKDKIVTFDGLPKELQTRANYELAESFLYHDVKICNLRDDDGTVVGKRLEVRAADSGKNQNRFAPYIITALVPDGPTGTAFDELLTTYGFTGNPVADADLLTKARTDAVYHSGKFMDVPFGRNPKTGRKASLCAFAKEVRGLLDKHYEAIAPISNLGGIKDDVSSILETGRSDAKYFASLFSSLEDVSRSMSKSERMFCLTDFSNG